jgi:hypothetical protein
LFGDGEGGILGSGGLDGLRMGLVFFFEKGGAREKKRNKREFREEESFKEESESLGGDKKKRRFFEKDFERRCSRGHFDFQPIWHGLVSLCGPEKEKGGLREDKRVIREKETFKEER